MTTGPCLPDLDLCLPDTWTVARGRGATLLRARSRDVPASGFAPRITVTRRGSPGGGGPVPTFDVEIEDEDAYELGHRPVIYRRVSWRVDRHEVLSEQWFWEIGGTEFVLTCTVARQDYLDHYDVFERIATVAIAAGPA